MKLEQQVCSLELAKRLKELGVKQDSLWWWSTHVTARVVSSDHDLCTSYHDCGEFPCGGIFPPELSKEGDEDTFSAFTVAELGEMLPVKEREYWNIFGKDKYGWFAAYNKPQFGKANLLNIESAPTEADARAKMLIYLLENKLISLT